MINIEQLNVANCLDNYYIQSSLNLQSKGFESTLTGCGISKCYLLESVGVQIIPRNIDAIYLYDRHNLFRIICRFKRIKLRD